MEKIASFKDMGRILGHNASNEGRKMNAGHKNSPEYDAVTKYYNHNSRYGFVYATIPAGTVLEYAIVTSDQDDLPGVRFDAGDQTDRPVVIEAFIHGSIIERAGYEMGLSEKQPLKVKLTRNDKGIQVVYTPNKDGSRPRTSNEPRLANSALKFVKATVKIYYKDRNFGFVVVDQDHKTGEPLIDENGKPYEKDVHFTTQTLARAGYTSFKEWQEIYAKYWTYENGRSSVTQFKFPDETADPDTVSEEYKNRSRNFSQNRAA